MVDLNLFLGMEENRFSVGEGKLLRTTDRETESAGVSSHGYIPHIFSAGDLISVSGVPEKVFVVT